MLLSLKQDPLNESQIAGYAFAEQWRLPAAHAACALIRGELTC